MDSGKCVCRLPDIESDKPKRQRLYAKMPAAGSQASEGRRKLRLFARIGGTGKFFMA